MAPQSQDSYPRIPPRIYPPATKQLQGELLTVVGCCGLAPRPRPVDVDVPALQPKPVAALPPHNQDTENSYAKYFWSLARRNTGEMGRFERSGNSSGVA